MIKSDRTIETHHYTRRIELAEPRTIKSKKGTQGQPKPKKYKYKIKYLVITWRHGEVPHTVIAYGKGKKAFGRKVEFRKSYDWTNLPAWIEEILDGDSHAATKS